MSSRATGNGQGSRDNVPPCGISPTSGPTHSVPQRRAIRVVNPLGLHHRVADQFSRTARQYTCTITVWNGTTRADGRSLIELILLVALPGCELVLEADGPDALPALDSLSVILAAPQGEDYTH